jgi:hypothetical protein
VPQATVPSSAHASRPGLAICDSLEKVFPDQAPRRMDPSVPVVGYAGARANLQVALQIPRGDHLDTVTRPEVRIQLPAGVGARVHQVDLVPVAAAAPVDADPAEYLRTAPGLYPDLLRPLDTQVVGPDHPDEPTRTDGPDAQGSTHLVVRPDLTFDAWHTLWIVLDVAPDAPTARATVDVEVTCEDGSVLAGQAPVLTVGRTLPELGIVNTHWFHCDGLMDVYDLEPFSERYWDVTGNFLRSAADMSVNSVLTPVWTPPLDTEVGSTRRPSQLLVINDDGDGHYRFDPSRLQRWLDLAESVGITRIEVPPLFTQWGAEATPAIWVQTPQGPEQRFGWDVPATDPRYRALLEQLLPYLIDYLDEHWGIDRVIFHISDEPGEDNLPTYTAAREVVADLLADVTVVDALSSYEFHRRGLVDHPISSTNHAAPFLEAGVDPLWVYYCISQKHGVANRFIAQPSARNRALGTQLFVNGAAGFLHWGFNFYNSQFSIRPVNPFLDTCAGGGFLGGDAFMVYPGPGGRPLTSIRYEVFAEAMTDHRAAQLLAQDRGRDAARDLLRDDWSDGYELPPITADQVRAAALAVAEELAGE